MIVPSALVCYCSEMPLFISMILVLQNGSCGLLGGDIYHTAPSKERNWVMCLSYSFHMAIFITISLSLFNSLQNAKRTSAKYLSVLKVSFTLWTIWYLPGGRIIANKNRIIHGDGKSHTHNLGNCHLKHHW